MTGNMGLFLKEKKKIRKSKKKSVWGRHYYTQYQKSGMSDVNIHNSWEQHHQKKGNITSLELSMSINKQITFFLISVEWFC